MPGRRIPALASVVLAIVAISTVVRLVVATELTETDAASPLRVSPSPSPSRSADPRARSSFAVDVGQKPVTGFPREWREMVARDGTFRAVVRPPVYVYELDDGGWEIEFGGYDAPHLYMYGRPVPPMSGPQGRALARSQIEVWAGASADPVPVWTVGRGGRAGWEATVVRDGKVLRYRVFVVRGWVVGMSTRRGRRNDAAGELATAILRSFEALGRERSDVPVSV